MKYSPEVIGKTIMKERLKLNVTQAQLGDKIHVSGKQISNYEKGKLLPPLDTLLELCDVFNCELGYLLGEASYEQGSALETEIHKLTGLSKESMNAVLRVTGTAHPFRHSPKEYRRIINSLFCSEWFPQLIVKIHDLDKLYNEYHGVWKRLENEIGNERYQKAWEHYDDEWDYEHDPQAPELSDEEAHDMSLIEPAIDEQATLGEEMEIAQYHVSKAFDNLIDKLYP